MANTKSARKNIRKTARRRIINRARASGLKTQIKKLRARIGANDAEGASSELPRVYATIDRSMRKGILHRNTAARYKSRLTRAVRNLSSPAR